MAAMKILLQCARSHTYVRDVDSWTTLPEQALEFNSLVPALDFALSYGLKDVRPVTRWEPPVAELHLPLSNAAALAPLGT